jgi:hypothetical protein
MNQLRPIPNPDKSGLRLRALDGASLWQTMRLLFVGLGSACPVSDLSEHGDSVYDRCHGWRKNSKSLKNTLDRTVYGGRMIA